MLSATADQLRQDATVTNNRQARERYVQIIRTEVPEANVSRLLKVHGDAIAEAKRLCPLLTGAELIQLGGREWLHVLTWSEPNGEAALMGQAEHFKSLTEMHSLFGDAHKSEVGQSRDLV